jgi:hypothetical protein
MLGRANNNKATTGKCFNCRKQGYWAKECRQLKKDRDIPVQVSILEATERKLLPIPEPEDDISDTPSARMQLASILTQDLLDRQEHQSTISTDSTSSASSDTSDWGLLAELPMPPKNYKDYTL